MPKFQVDGHQLVAILKDELIYLEEEITGDIGNDARLDIWARHMAMQFEEYELVGDLGDVLRYIPERESPGASASDK